MVKSVLLVEDNDSMRGALSLLLNRLGYVVTAAASIADGLAMLDGQAVAIVDVMLADGTGDTLLREIRQRNLPIKVAMMSAGMAPGIRENIMQLSPDRFFNKPLDIPSLINWISGLSHSAK